MRPPGSDGLVGAEQPLGRDADLLDHLLVLAIELPHVRPPDVQPEPQPEPGGLDALGLGDGEHEGEMLTLLSPHEHLVRGPVRPLDADPAWETDGAADDHIALPWTESMGPPAESGIVNLFDDVVDGPDEPIAVLFYVNDPVCGLAPDPRPHDAAVQIGGVALVEPVLHGVAPIAPSLAEPTQHDDALPEEVVGHVGLEGRRLAVADVDEDDAGAFLDRVCPHPHALVPDNGRVATVDQGSTEVAVGHVVCPPVVRTRDRAREQALAHREGHAAVEAAVVQGERPALVTDE